MHYAIVINLDYNNFPLESCHLIWQEIHDSMLNAGFILDGRIFTIECDSTAEATQRARDAIDSIEAHMDYHEKRVYLYIKEFYGYDLACTENLLVPPSNSIELEED